MAWPGRWPCSRSCTCWPRSESGQGWSCACRRRWWAWAMPPWCCWSSSWPPARKERSSISSFDRAGCMRMWCRTIPQSRRTLAAGLLFFLAAQLAFNIVADMRHPELYDPEYGVRLALLRARMAEMPDRPLLLLIGSSRTVMSFPPEVLGELRSADGARVLPFNFSHLAAGPLINLIAYDRLRRAGIRPTWLVMEVMAPNLSREPGTTPTTIASAGHLPLLDHHIHRPTLSGRYVILRVPPCHR